MGSCSGAMKCHQLITLLVCIGTVATKIFLVETDKKKEYHSGDTSGIRDHSGEDYKWGFESKFVNAKCYMYHTRCCCPKDKFGRVFCRRQYKRAYGRFCKM